MKKQQSATMLFSRLPEQVQADIFLKLPLKCIGMCRCVCKLWRHLLCNHKFTKYHLDYSILKNNPKLMLRGTMNDMQDILYYINYASISSLSASSQTCECQEVARMHYPFEYDQDQDGRFIYILGSCNGLICLAISGHPLDIDYRLCIWNPFTREYKKMLGNVDVKDHRLRCGFGYDYNNEDYKFVRIWDDLERPGYFKAQVYSLKSDSWTIQSIPYLFPFGGTLCPSVLSGGALHWLGVTTTKETNSEAIVSFDISSERFIDVDIPEETMAPPVGSQSDKNLVKNLGILRDCLCLVVRVSCMVYGVWVMQDYGVKESCNKQFTINQMTIYDFWNIKPIWTLKNGEILISTLVGFYLYDPKNERGTELLVHPENCLQAGGFTMTPNQSYCYVESLVSLYSSTYVD